jgi:hypothetical protein
VLVVVGGDSCSEQANSDAATQMLAATRAEKSRLAEAILLLLSEPDHRTPEGPDDTITRILDMSVEAQ